MNSFILLFALHKLLALAFLLGLIFFIAWAIKNLTKDKLKKWAITLLVIGIVGCLLTTLFGGFGHWKFKSAKLGFSKMHSGMWSCMKDEGCRSEMESMMERRGIK